MKERIHVQNLTSTRSGEAVRNQFIITGETYRAFQSYDSLIAIYDDGLILGRHWDYSRTTLKYLHQFIEEYFYYQVYKKLPAGKSFADSIRKAIAQGIIIYDPEMV